MYSLLKALRTGDRNILLHEMTPKSELIDLLSVLGKAPDAKLVELLSSLEQCQVTYATIRNLAVEEQRVTEVDPAAIIRISLESGKVASSLMAFHAQKRDFGAMLTLIDNSVMTSAPLSEYPFIRMLAVLDHFYTVETEKAVLRWHHGLEDITTKLTKSMPQDWRRNAVEASDESWIKEHLLNQALVNNLGQDYNHGARWLRSMHASDVLKNTHNDVVRDKFNIE